MFHFNPSFSFSYVAYSFILTFFFFLKLFKNNFTTLPSAAQTHTGKHCSTVRDESGQSLRLGPVYVYISIASLLTQEPRRSTWSLCVGGVTGTVFFFFFLRGTFGKGDRSDDFFLLYSHIYTAGYFAFKFQCTSPLFVCSREGKK